MRMYAYDGGQEQRMYARQLCAYVQLAGDRRAVGS